MPHKGKGRQSGNWDRKSLRAVHTRELQQRVHEEVTQTLRRRPQTSLATTASASRPQRRLTNLQQLQSLLRERQCQDVHLRREQIRRGGYLLSSRQPNNNDDNHHHSKASNLAPTTIRAHAPGWLLKYSDTLTSKEQQQEQEEATKPASLLQSLCLNLLVDYVFDYLQAMGATELRNALSLLPSDTLQDLSIGVCQRWGGMTKELLWVIGSHSHVEGLCLGARVANGDEMEDDGAFWTDQDLKRLVPTREVSSTTTTTTTEIESWEELMEVKDPFSALCGCSWRLKRLELLDLRGISTETVQYLLQRCSWITHLSLAGSVFCDGGEDELLAGISEWLPSLQVLDVTRCHWWKDAEYRKILRETYNGSSSNNNNKQLIVYSQSQGHEVFGSSDGTCKSISSAIPNEACCKVW